MVRTVDGRSPGGRAERTLAYEAQDNEIWFSIQYGRKDQREEISVDYDVFRNGCHRFQKRVIDRKDFVEMPGRSPAINNAKLIRLRSESGAVKFTILPDNTSGSAIVLQRPVFETVLRDLGLETS